MIATDRLPAILQAMTDAAHEAGDVVLASALAAAVDLHALAPLLPLTGGDAMLGHGLHAIVTGNVPADVALAAADRALACRVAARLASTSALLRAVDPTGHAEEAATLWTAATHLGGMDDGSAAKERDRMLRALAWWGWHASDVDKSGDAGEILATATPDAIARSAEAAIYIAEKRSPGGYRPPTFAEYRAQVTADIAERLDHLPDDSIVKRKAKAASENAAAAVAAKDPNDLHPESAIITTMRDYEEAWASVRETAVEHATRHGVDPQIDVSSIIEELSEKLDAYRNGSDTLRDITPGLCAIAIALGVEVGCPTDFRAVVRQIFEAVQTLKAAERGTAVAMIAAADKRARDASAECIIRLHAELDKARKDNAALGEAVAAARGEREAAERAAEVYLEERNRFASEASRLRHSLAVVRDAVTPASA